jgi:hypothetical protein
MSKIDPEILAEFGHFDQAAIKSGVEVGKQTVGVKEKLQRTDSVKENISKVDPESTLNSINQAQYFNEASKLPDSHTRLFLEEPPVRSYSGNDQFDNYPCSSGMKGPAQFYKPGTSVNMKWQIQNGTKDGKCVIRLSEKGGSDISSYKVLHPLGKQTDQYTGYFDCGNKSGEQESAEVVIPHSSECTE